jgi:hypothetical protein
MNDLVIFMCCLAPLAGRASERPLLGTPLRAVNDRNWR